MFPVENLSYNYTDTRIGYYLYSDAYKLQHEISEELREIRETLAQKYAEPAGAKAPGEMYRCRFCGLSYNYMTTLRAHERVHDVDEPYVCSRCGLSYRYYVELQAHSLEHKGDLNSYTVKF